MAGAKKERQEDKKSREAEKAASTAAAKKQAEEDAYWAAHGEGSKSKAQAKKEEEAKKAEEARKRREENKRLADEEAEAEAKAAKGKPQPKWDYSSGSKKVTAHELYLQKERELAEMEKKMKEMEAAEKGLVSEGEYARLVEQVNRNREQLAQDARGLDQALQALGVTGEADEPVTLTYKEYEARELPQVKEDKPGLKLPQYREIIWKAWERAIENPRSQTRKDWEAGRAKKEGLAGGSS